mmetsp:Transcript_29337/g.77413  ORF Transcript_29337/g.77413 Transcript_29337/m.77413 type:complete len:251 (-) Transcript_29337:151-903(-)
MEASEGTGDVQWSPPALVALSNSGRSLTSILDSMLDVVVQEGYEAQAAPTSWGQKSEHSVFDEDEILTRGLPPSHHGEQEQLTHSSAASIGGFGPEQVPAYSSLASDGMVAEQPSSRDSFAGSAVSAQDGRHDSSWTGRHVGPSEQLAQEAENAAVIDPVLISAMIAAWLSPAEPGEPRALRAMQRACCVHKLEMNAEEACPICLESLCRDQAAWRLPCMHLIHGACAVQYFRRRGVRPACPICRYDVRP